MVKNVLISTCGYEIEILGIPEKYVTELTTLVWGFIWGWGINQIDDIKKCCCVLTFLSLNLQVTTYAAYCFGNRFRLSLVYIHARHF